MKKIILYLVFQSTLLCFNTKSIDWKNQWIYEIGNRDLVKEVDTIFIENKNLSAEEIIKKNPDYKYQVFAASRLSGSFINSCPEGMQKSIFSYLWNGRQKHPAYLFSDLIGLVTTQGVMDLYKWIGIMAAGSYILQTYFGPIVGPKFHNWYKKYLFKNDINPEKSNVKWDDIIGLDNIKNELEEIYENIKKQKHTGKLEKNNHILFYGAPGNGKTFVAQGFANRLNIPYFYISVAKLFENKDSIQLAFEKLSLYAKKHKTPILVFIDEIDLVIPSRKQKSISAEEKQQLQNFLSILDGKDCMEGVLVIVNTNYKDDLDEALLRDGRIGFHIEFTNPTEIDIKELFIHFAKEFEIIIPDEFDYAYFCDQTKAYSIAKIRTLVKNIASKAKKINKNRVLDNQTLYTILNK